MPGLALSAIASTTLGWQAQPRRTDEDRAPRRTAGPRPAARHRRRAEAPEPVAVVTVPATPGPVADPVTAVPQQREEATAVTAE